MKRTFTGLLFLISVIFCKTAFANVYIGSEITYTSSNDTFYFTVAVTHDCSGITPSAPVLKISHINGAGAVNYNTTLLGSRDITPICNSLYTICNGGTFSPAVEERTSTVAVYLGSNLNCELMAVIDLCCRSGTITTGQGGQMHYNELRFNKCLAPT